MSPYQACASHLPAWASDDARFRSLNFGCPGLWASRQFGGGPQCQYAIYCQEVTQEIDPKDGPDDPWFGSLTPLSGFGFPASNRRGLALEYCSSAERQEQGVTKLQQFSASSFGLTIVPWNEMRVLAATVEHGECCRELWSLSLPQEETTICVVSPLW